ncbi:hypothetical protein [Streptomyces niveus]|uniref:hypothetical protein n=1 Tax=Streptomyces niveus TaxID=193462 RepID=UPI00343264C9
MTVGLSVLLHGATAPFLGTRYGDWFAKTLPTDPDLRENALASDDVCGTRAPRGP